MSILDWVLLISVVIEAIAIPIAFLNGFKSGMLIQYEKANQLPPIVPAMTTFSKPTVNSNGMHPEQLEDPHYTEVV